jgi:hypothetical protein
MAVNNESAELIREKKELDTFLSSFTNNSAPVGNNVKDTTPFSGDMPSLVIEFNELNTFLAKLERELVSKPKVIYSQEFIREFNELNAFLGGLEHDLQTSPAHAKIKVVPETKIVSPAKIPAAPKLKEPVVEEKVLPASNILEARPTPPAEKFPKEEKPVLPKTEIKAKKPAVPPSTPLKGKKEQPAIQPPIRLWKYAAASLIIIVLLIGAYFFLYPDTLDQAEKWVASITGTEKNESDAITSEIRLTNIRHRFVKNTAIGQLRVIQGDVLNNWSTPITAINVLAKLYNDNSVLIMSSSSYCGRIYSDEKLAGMTEDEINKVMTIPHLQGIPTEKVMPDNSIPYMIIFSRESTPVAKVIVEIASFERLSN